MRRIEAIEADAKFYTGKLCKRHPELKGQRRAKNRNCHKCIVERMQRTRRAEKKRRRQETNSAK